MIDEFSNDIYSVQMLSQLDINLEDILKMILFDALIGNSDRHPSNWAYVYNYNANDTLRTFSPLYDNGSSLCSYVNEEDIDNIIKDKTRYNSLIDTKSKSTIGWENKRPIKHFELVAKIKENYFDITLPFIENIKNKLTYSCIEEIINNFPDSVLSKKKKEL